MKLNGNTTSSTQNFISELVFCRSTCIWSVMQHNIYFTLCARMISINKLRPGWNVAFHKNCFELMPMRKICCSCIRFVTCEMLKCYPEVFLEIVLRVRESEPRSGKKRKISRKTFGTRVVKCDVWTRPRVSLEILTADIALVFFNLLGIFL